MRAAASASCAEFCTISVRPPLSAVISRSAAAFDPGVDRLPVRRVDRDRVDERVAAPQRRPQLAQGRGAGGVGAVGDDQHRGALARRACRSAAAPRGSRRRSPCRRTAAARRARGARRPARASTPVSGRGRWLNAITKNSSAGSSSSNRKRVDRGARIVHPLAEHAVADVEQHAEADRHALAGELGDGLADAVLVDLERVAVEAGHRMTVAIGDRRGDAGDFDAGLERAMVGDRRLLGERAGRPEREGARESRGGQTRAHHSILAHARPVRVDSGARSGR